MPPAATPLDYAILGLLHGRPMTGYALRKLFATTPMGHYSDSPGSIYPALERLRRNGLVTPVIEGAETLRPRRVFRLTGAGRDALTGWVSAPVTRDEIVRGRGSVMLRFVFSERVLGPAAALRFLETFERTLAAYLPELESHYDDSGPALSLGARLALHAGVEAHRAQLRWVRDAAKEFRRCMASQPGLMDGGTR